MNRKCGLVAVAALAVGLVAGAAVGPMVLSPSGETIPMADPMDYPAFRDRAVAELATHADLIGFEASAPFLQQMRQAAPLWSPLLLRLIADPTVAIEVKLGALPVIFDLPPADLVQFADRLNALSLQEPALFPLVLLATTNAYRGGGFLPPGRIADTSLIDLDARPDARMVLAQIARNPALDPALLQPGQFMAAYAPAE